MTLSSFCKGPTPPDSSKVESILSLLCKSIAVGSISEKADVEEVCLAIQFHTLHPATKRIVYHFKIV